MVDLWPNWIGFAVSALLVIVTVLTAYNGDTGNKKVKFICAFWVYVVSTGVYGALALGQTEFDREDGKGNLFWGYVAMWALRYGAICAFITASITYALWNAAVSFVFGTLAGVGLLLCQFTLNQDQRIFWFCFAGAAWMANLIYWVLIALRMDRWFMFPQKSKSTTGEGTNVALSAFWTWAVVIIAALTTGSWHVCWALERGGWDNIHDFFLSIILYVFVCDGIVIVLLMLFCLWFINPDGSVSDRNALLNVGKPAARLINPKGIPTRPMVNSSIGHPRNGDNDSDSDDETGGMEP